MAHRSDEDPLDVDRYLYGDNSANRQGSPQKDKSMGQKLQVSFYLFSLVYLSVVFLFL